MRRQKVWDALVRVHSSQNRLEHFHACGAGVWAQTTQDGNDVRLVANCCHDRFCIPCQTARANRIRNNLHDLIADQTFRFFTFTLRHNNTQLRDQLKRLKKSFREMTRRAIWKETQTGWIAFLEVKLDRQNELWHPHLHVIATGHFTDQRQLSRAWLAITGDSSIVDVQRKGTPGQMANYVSKYVTKPADSSVLNHPDKLDEFIVSMKGQRLYELGGNLRGHRLDEMPEDGRTWKNISSIDRLIEDAHAGELAAVALLCRIEEKYPHLAYLWHRDRAPP